MSFPYSKPPADPSSPTPRPSLVEIVEQYGVSLRRAGKEYVGLCPLHSEKTPSFYVNEDKGLFFCHGCGAKGSVFDFVMQIEGVDFKGALAHPTLADCPGPTSAEIKKLKTIRKASWALTTWALSVSERIGARMRELGQRAYRARKVLRELPGADEEPLLDEIENCERQWDILQALDDDLNDPVFLLELWKQRDSVEVIAHG